MKMSHKRGERGTGKNYPHMLSVTLDDDRNDKLLKLCHTEDVDKTQAIRAALDLLFEKYGINKP